MSREEFINNQWLPYPSILSDGSAFFFGRVSEVNKDFIQLVNQQDFLKYLVKDTCELQDDHYGPSISPEYLKVGDAVVFIEDKRAIYLLSPCLRADKDFLNTGATEWALFLESIAIFFKTRKFIHLQTPNLVVSPGVDHHIDFLQVEAVKTGRRWCLPTSPEIHLKKYLCQGYDRIFEIKNCFRDDLASEHHKVEFTMLEWYRAYVNLDAIKNDVCDLLKSLVPNIPEPESLRVSEAFMKWLGFELKPETSRDELYQLASACGLDTASDDDWNDLFFRIFMEKIEPQLGLSGPLFLSHFPSQQASLSQIDGEGWSQRFELYWQGVELANAYLEVNNPEENRKIFLSEQSLREKKGASVAEVDEGFFNKLESGMPPASGIALGLDRLFKLTQKHS